MSCQKKVYAQPLIKLPNQVGVGDIKPFYGLLADTFFEKYKEPSYNRLSQKTNFRYVDLYAAYFLTFTVKVVQKILFILYDGLMLCQVPYFQYNIFSIKNHLIRNFMQQIWECKRPTSPKLQPSKNCQTLSSNVKKTLVKKHAFLKKLHTEQNPKLLTRVGHK